MNRVMWFGVGILWGILIMAYVQVVIPTWHERWADKHGYKRDGDDDVS